AYLHNPDELQKIANKISPEIGLRLLKCNQNDEKTIDIIKVLDMFYYSQYGQLFSTSGKAKDKVINIKESLEKKEIVLFLFDAASYKTDTSLLGKLVINDINNAWASFGSYGRSVKGYCIFDEFAAYASSNLSNVLALQRDNGLHAVVGTQSINAIKTDNKSLKRVAVELIANCNTYIVHKLNDPEDILLLQNAIGKYKTYEANIHVNSSNNSKYKVNEQTGISYRLSEEFYLDGHEIRKLTPGNGFIYRGVINDIPRKIKFNYIC
ncbi:MAG TPA: TraM recognition domain-containing protein, partial [Burkholderiales bacterium]|nr:TraM recognition domain-containing protein [Burkholderiales bacterium]